MTNGNLLVGTRAGVALQISRASIREQVRSEFIQRFCSGVGVGLILGILRW